MKQPCRCKASGGITGLKQTALLFSAIASANFCAGVYAQEPVIADLQKNIEIFSGVLTEALDLEQATGFFGMSLGGIDSTYLYGQGVVLEVRTPLANRRNTLSLAALNSTLQDMQTSSNPFEILSRTNNPAPQATPAQASTPSNAAEEFYRAMMERISNVDYSLRINSAIQQAADYARSLRSLEKLGEIEYTSVLDDLDAIRVEMQVEFERLRLLEEQLGQAASVAANNVTENELWASLDNVLERLEPLRDRAVAKAEELRERSRVAEQEYAESWEQEVAVFEVNVYSAMCDYGSTLHLLPDDEHVTVILTGLGVDSGESRRSDKLHVFNKSDLVSCQNGEINAHSLQERSRQYSY